MNKLLALVVFQFLLLTFHFSSAQNVGIGTNSPNNSAQLDVTSTNKGFLPPRMTYNQRKDIQNPAAGLIVFCTDCGASGEMQYYNGSNWMNMTIGIGSVPLAVPTLSTTTASSVTQTTATIGGNITSDGGDAVIARGVVWNTSPNPTVALATKTQNGSGTGPFTSNITGLTAKTTYYVRAYATNSAGTGYGNEVSFVTNSEAPTLPSITTNNVSNITNLTAISGGNITSDGGAQITERGICWSTNQNPTVNLSTKTTNGSGIGNFSDKITGINPATTYYVRAYATNSAGTAYGNQITFRTIIRIPVVFHVLTDQPNGVSNISDCIIQNQIELLNNCFRRKSGAPNTNILGADTEIEFYLAKKNPSGEVTTGINRVTTANCNYTSLTSTSNTQTRAIRAAAQWPINRYLNIWVLKSMPNSNQVRGQAWTGGNDMGVFVHYSFVGSKNSNCPNISYLDITGFKAYDLGMTLVHEIGHYLSLLHTFAPSTGTCSYSDGCDDTPAVVGLPNALCGSNNDTRGVCVSGQKRQWQNYLDYTDDACMDRFTPCQANKMRNFSTSTIAEVTSRSNYINTGGEIE